MNNLRHFSLTSLRIAVACSIVFCSGNLRALGPGVAGNTAVAGTTGANGGVSGAAAVSGGSRGGAVAGNGAGRAPAVVGPQPSSPAFNSAPRLAVGTSTRNDFSRGSAPTSYAGARTVPPALNGSRPTARNQPNPANAWSGTAVATTSAPSVRLPAWRSTDQTTGQHLNPGANGANLPTGTNLSANRSDRSGRSGRYRSPFRFYRYRYGPVFGPYIGYYGGGYAGAYPYYAGDVSADIAAAYDNGAPVASAEYADQGQDASDARENPVPAPIPAEQRSTASVQPTVPTNGPDSLVEAVQEELIRRGYFAGKVDAMFGGDTKEALRKFQQDHHLADSGLINEATLHALQLD